MILNPWILGLLAGHGTLLFIFLLAVIILIPQLASVSSFGPGAVPLGPPCVQIQFRGSARRIQLPFLPESVDRYYTGVLYEEDQAKSQVESVAHLTRDKKKLLNRLHRDVEGGRL